MRQLPDDSEQHHTARADRLEYFAIYDLIVLLGARELRSGRRPDERGAHRVRLAPRASQGAFPIRCFRAQTSGQEQEPGRVRITINPKTDPAP